MYRHSVRLVAACLATCTIIFVGAEIQADLRAKSRLERLLAGRHNITVADISADLLTGRLSLGGLAVEAGRWHVSVGRLQLPLDHVGLGLVSAAHASPLPDTQDNKPTAAATPSGNASAENVVITDGATTYRLKRIDLVGTPLSNADLAALLDPAKPDSLEVRLRKLTAASITIPELTADSSVGATEQHWAQRQIVLSDVTQGKVAGGSIGPSTLAIKNGDNASNVEIGGLQLAGIDMGQTAHVFAASRTDDTEAFKPMYDSVIATAVKVTDVKNNQTVTIALIQEEGLKGRAFKTDARTQSSRLSGAKPGDPAVNAFLDDLLNSVSAKLIEVDDVAAVPSAGAKPADLSTFGVKQIAVHDIGGGNRIGDMGLQNFHFEGKQGRLTLASVSIGGLSFPPAETAEGPSADGSKTDGQSADPMPSLAKLDLSDFRFDLNVAGKQEPGQRITFAIDRIAYSAIGLDTGRLPAKSVGSVSHVTYDVPPNDPSLQTLSALGYKRLDVSSNISSAYDAKQQTLAIDKFVLGGVDMGSMELKLDLSNVSDKIVSQNPEVQKASALALIFRDLDLVIHNDGLVDKALQYRAKADGKSVEDEKTSYTDAVTNQLPLLAGGSPKIAPLQAALVKFIASPKTLHVAIATKNGLGLADVGLLSDPSSLLDVLDIHADAND